MYLNRCFLLVKKKPASFPDFYHPRADGLARLCAHFIFHDFSLPNAYLRPRSADGAIEVPKRP